MPRVSVWMIRSSLLYLLAGFTLGGLMLAGKGMPVHPGVWRFLPLHAEVMLSGWLVQFALGVAFWILPRLRGGARGNQRLAWLAAGLLNLGIFSSLLGLWLPSAGALLAGRLCEASAAIFFLAILWKRVRALPR